MIKKGVMYVAALLVVAGVVGGTVVGGMNAKASSNEKELTATVENNNAEQELSVMETVDSLLEEGATIEDVSLAFIGIQAEAYQAMAAESGEDIDEESIISEIDKKADEFEALLNTKKELKRGCHGLSCSTEDVNPNEYYDWGIFEFLNFTFPNSQFTLKDCIYELNDMKGDAKEVLKDAFAAWKTFNTQEKILAVRYPTHTIEAYVANNNAIKHAEEEFGSCEAGTQADAFRQALWTLDLTTYMDQEKIMQFVNASVSDEKDDEIKEMTVNNGKKGMALRDYHMNGDKEKATLMTMDEMKDAVKKILTNDAESGLYWVK